MTYSITNGVPGVPASGVLGALLFNVILELYWVVLRDYSGLSAQRSSVLRDRARSPCMQCLAPIEL